ncbi:MAG TPA: hypothetical protein VF241_03260 [Propionibacteriaceae bacterium]
MISGRSVTVVVRKSDDYLVPRVHARGMLIMAEQQRHAVGL